MAPEPLYQRIADELEELIGRGEVEPFERLPTEQDLAAKHGTTRPTVRQAYDTLIAKGRVVRRARDGYYVRPARDVTWHLCHGGGIVDPWRHLADSTGGRASEVLRVELVPAGRAVRGTALADMLSGVEGGELVVCRSAVRSLGGDVVELSDAYAPYGLVVERLPEFMSTDRHDDPLALLAGAGVEVSDWCDATQARIPTEAETDRLELPQATPVMDVLRLVRFGEQRECLLVLRSVFRGDGAVFVSESRA